MQSEHVQPEVCLEGWSLMPATDPINQGSDPSELLDLSIYLLIRIGTPNDVQGPHFGVPKTAALAA